MNKDNSPSVGLLDQVLREARTTFRVQGIPTDAARADAAELRSRLLSAVRDFEAGHPGRPLELVVTNRGRPSGTQPTDGAADVDVLSLEQRASFFHAEQPLYTFDDLILPQVALDQLILAVAIVELRPQVFDAWHLREIQPRPGSALNFHGDPGTGKTLAAHAVASRLGKPIIRAKYSQLESKYHGEGPKNLQALFEAARANDAVLFVDEADSLLSQRFENVSQGSEHAVNAMRSELLLALDEYEGLVVFASNFAQSYDRAFDSRVRHVAFPAPDADARLRLWRRHLVPGLPLAEDVSLAELAELEGLSGRHIRDAVIEAATSARLEGLDRVWQRHLVAAVEAARSQRPILPRGRPTMVAAGSAQESALLAATHRALTNTDTSVPPSPLREN